MKALDAKYNQKKVHTIDQIIEHIRMIIFTTWLLMPNNNSNLRRNIARNKGKIQYPNIATACKYETLPPSSFTLNDTTVEPKSTEKNNRIN